MAGEVDARLRELGVELPAPTAPVANYLPAAIAGNFLFISGQMPMGPDGLAYVGKLGQELDIETGQKAARLAAINVLAQAKGALGDLIRIKRFARLTGFVNGTSDFAEPHLVINGASDFLVDVFAVRGKHSRTVLVAANLPMNAATLIDAIIEIE